MQVLIIKMSSMGDIVHTLPALTDAKNKLQNIYFDWVVEENFIEIPMWHSAVREVIPIAIRRWRNNWFNHIIRKERYMFTRLLKHKKYDKIIDAQGLIKSALFVVRIANGEKHGLDYKSARESFASYFYHQQHKISKQQHAVERIRYLFAMSLGYKLPTSFRDYNIINNFSLNKNNKKPYLMFLHSSSRKEKHWPEYKWSKLILLANHHGYQIKLPWGTESEYKRAVRLAQNNTNVIVLPKLSLTEIAKQLMNSMAIISVDTGLCYLAGALNRPTITLFGPTEPKLVGGCTPHQQNIYGWNGNISNIRVSYVWMKFQQILSYK